MSFIIEKLSKTGKKNILSISIDGPTATGKSSFAKNIVKESKDNKCHIFEVDWTMKKRAIRAKDIKNMLANGEILIDEIASHMYMDKCEKLANIIKEINCDANFKERLIKFNNLYNRDDNGNLTKSISYLFKKGSCLIVEGHYSNHKILEEIYNLKVLLLADIDVMIDRKVNRVKSYRTKQEALDYFWHIDIPSFINYIKNVSKNGLMIVDNSDYENSKIKDADYLDRWIEIAKDEMIEHNSNFY